MLSQIGMKRPNRRRTLRSISASVGKGVVTAVLPMLRGRAAPVTAQNGSCRKISGNWPFVSTHADNYLHSCYDNNYGIIMLLRLDFLSVADV